MTELLKTTLQHLEYLIAFDTQNPPREIRVEGIFSYIQNRHKYYIDFYYIKKVCFYLH